MDDTVDWLEGDDRLTLNKNSFFLSDICFYS